VSLAAGESSRPHKTIPRAVKATFFRIIIFYILSMLTIGLCINAQDPTLLTAAAGGYLQSVLWNGLLMLSQTQAWRRRPLPSSSCAQDSVPPCMSLMLCSSLPF
jgi:amino acid transporter